MRCRINRLELNCLKIFKMKKGVVKFFLVIAIISLAACKEDVPTLFNEQDGVYFNSSKDSVFYTFAKYPSRLVDTIKLPVSVLGNSAAVDREINIEKVPGAGNNA